MTLERTYRRLLAAYPWEHRRQYEEEMLGVLLADAGQRHRPRGRDVLDLLNGALRAHVRCAATRLAGPHWRDAAAAVGLLAALAMLAFAVRPVLLGYTWMLYTGEPPTLLSWHSWPRLVAWIAVVGAAAAGWRRVAAVLAWAAAALEVARSVQESVDYSQPAAIFDLWPVALALVGAATLTVTARRSGAAVFGRLRVGLLAGAALLVSIAPTIATVVLPGDTTLRTDWIFTRTVELSEALCIMAGLALGALSVLTMPPALRRRIVALLAPVAAALLVTRLGLDWILSDSQVRGYPNPLTPAQWLAVVGIPVLTLGVAVSVVHRWDRAPHVLAITGKESRG
jgi:hypothetical protein